MAASGRIRRAAAVAATAILVLALGVGLAAVTRPEASTAERRVARVPAPAGPALANLPRGPKIPALIQKPESTVDTGRTPTVPPPPPAATSTAVPAPVAPTPAPQLAILFDAPTWIGKPASDFAAAFGQPIATSRHNPGAITSLPNGGLSREYKSGWGSVQCFFASDLPPAPCLGFLLYFDDATAPADFDDALRKTNLPLGRPPDTQRVPSIRTWSNLGGLYVGMTAKNAQAPQVVQINVRRAG